MTMRSIIFLMAWAITSSHAFVYNPHRVRPTHSRAAAATQGSDIPEMGFTSLGDLRVSKVCLGTMTWGEQNTIEEGEVFF
jgi:hypothetical protein